MRTATDQEPIEKQLWRTADKLLQHIDAADHGEVFTPPWMAEAMLDLVKDETERINDRVPNWRPCRS